MYPIIGLAGPAGCGKSSLANMLLEELDDYVLYGMAWPLKLLVNVMFGWNDDHSEGALKDAIDPEIGISPREAYQIIGSEFGRDLINNLLPNLKIPRGYLWVGVAQRALQASGKLIVADIRFPNEVEWIDKSGGLLVHVKRAGNYSGLTTDEKRHQSECGVLQRANDWSTTPCKNLEELAGEADRLADYIKMKETE